MTKSNRKWSFSVILGLSDLISFRSEARKAGMEVEFEHKHDFIRKRLTIETCFEECTCEIAKRRFSILAKVIFKPELVYFVHLLRFVLLFHVEDSPRVSIDCSLSMRNDGL